MRKILGLFCGWLVLAVAGNVSAAPPLETWALRTPYPGCNPIRDIAYGNGLWVAVGDSGTVLTSADDGQSWVVQNSGVTNLSSHFTGIIFTNNLFVAVGWQGLMATSANGTNWTLRTVGNLNSFWAAVTYGNGRYVAVGQDAQANSTNNVAVSLDATNWTQLSSGMFGNIADVTFAQGLFVGVGAGYGFSGGKVLTSADGTNWTQRVTNFFANLSGVTYGSGKFVGVGQTGTVVSSDGTNWLQLSDPLAPSRLGVTYGNGTFVSVGAGAPFYVSGISYTSTTGTNWTFSSLGPSEVVRFINGRFVAVGAPTPANVYLNMSINFSTNGVLWTSSGIGGAFPTSTQRRRAIVYGNGQFGLIEGDTTVRLSSNLVNFTFAYTANGLRALAFGNNEFNAATVNGSYTTLAASADNWVPFASLNGLLNDLCFANALWVGVGQEGSLATSPDADTWTDVSSGTTNDLFAVAGGGGAFVAVGMKGTVVRSANGTTWTSQLLAGVAELRAVAYGNGRFVTVGYAGKIYTSPDGTTWTARTSGTLLGLNAVSYCLGRFIAVGDGGVILSSPDGVAWTRAAALTEHKLRGVAASPTLAAVVGDSGVLLTSTDGLNWKLTPGQSGGIMWRVIRHNGQFIAAMDNGLGYSVGGRSWRSEPLVGTMYSLMATNSRIIAVGSGNSVSQSAIRVSADNGVTWFSTNLGSGGYLDGIAYGNGIYVAVGQNGVSFSSPDSTNWTARTSGVSTLYDVAFGSNVFVATIAGATNVLISTNGINWFQKPAGGAGTAFDSIVFRDGLFYAAGARIATSPNGITWTDRGAPSPLLTGLDKTPDNKYVAYGAGGILMVSTNLVNWVTIPIGTLQELNGGVFGNDTFLVVGRGGVVYQSDFLTDTPLSIVTPPAPVTVLLAGNASFSVAAGGRGPFSYQWFKNGALLSGATEATLQLQSVTATDAANYHVVVANDTASQASTTALLTIISASAGVNPEVLYLFTNTSGAFTVNVAGATPTGYQWRQYSNPIPGATNATLPFTNVQTSNSANYSVVVSFPFGQLLSTNEGYLAVMEAAEEVNLFAAPNYVQAPFGSTVTVTSGVYGPVPSSYRWRRDGTNIAGATNAVLTLNNVQASHSGNYGLAVGYALGSVTNEFVTTIETFFAVPPVITGIRKIAPGTVRVTFTGLTNRYYLIEYATTLVPPVTWTTYDGQLLTANPAFFDIFVPVEGTEAEDYFRIRILPP